MLVVYKALPSGMLPSWWDLELHCSVLTTTKKLNGFRSPQCLGAEKPQNFRIILCPRQDSLRISADRTACLTQAPLTGAVELLWDLVTGSLAVSKRQTHCRGARRAVESCSPAEPGLKLEVSRQRVLSSLNTRLVE